MKAMILAAGFGTRLRPLTNTIPKPLLPVAGTPLIVWNLLLPKHHGFRDVVIILHHLGPMIEQALGTGAQFGLRLLYSHEPIILGTGGGIKQAERYFFNELVLILNGDTLVDLDLEALCAFHHERKALATLVLREDLDAVRWGVVEVGADDQSVQDIALDFAESKLHEQIKEKDTIATIFYLKTKGKKRGYVEKQEISVEANVKPMIALHGPADT